MLYGNIALAPSAVITGVAGSATTPTLNFGTSNTGLYATAASQLGLSAAGSLVATFTSTGATFAQPLSMSSQSITNVANGVNPNDAVNLSQVQGLIQGISAKHGARAGTTAALPTYTYANGTSGVGATLTASANAAFPAQDGVTLTVGQYVLVKNETGANAPYNGTYTLTTVGSASAAWVLTRSVDMDQSTEFPGAFVFVEEGTTLAQTGWVSNAPVAFTVGTTNIGFVQFSAAGSYSAGSGITITGGVISAHVSGTTITTNGSGAIIVDSSATTGQVLLSAGTAGTEATWGAVNLASANAVTGTLSLANINISGGTAGAPTATSNLIPYYNGTSNEVMTIAQLAASSAFTGTYLSLAGGTMTGAITFNTTGPQVTTSTQALTVQPGTAATGLALNLNGGTATAGAGGSVNITAAAGVGTNQNGGNVVVIPGAATGTGTAGNIELVGAVVINSGANTVALPTTRGTAGQVLQTNGAGATSWVSFPQAYRTSFTNSTLVSGVLTVTHNLGNQYVHIQVYDNSNNQILPDFISCTSTTSASVTLTSFGTLTGTYNVVVIG